MPRLTNKTYLATRADLVELWNERDGAVFALLPTYAQRDLHDFYAPSVPMADSEALAHRVAMARAFPSLPQSAGRAAAVLHASIEKRPNQILERHRARSTRTITSGHQTRRLRVMGVARPTLDEHRLVKVIEALWRQGLDDDTPRSKK